MRSNPGEILSVQQIADYLQVKPSTIYDWCSRRHIPYLKAGKYNRFRKEVIDEWLKKHEVKPHWASN